MATETRDNKEQARYELLLDGCVVGFADYRIDGDRVVFPAEFIDANPEYHDLLST